MRAPAYSFVTQDGLTALILSVKYGKRASIAALLAAGASLETKDSVRTDAFLFGIFMVLAIKVLEHEELCCLERRAPDELLAHVTGVSCFHISHT